MQQRFQILFFNFKLWLFRRWLKNYVVKQGHDYRLETLQSEIWNAVKREYREDNVSTRLCYLMAQVSKSSNEERAKLNKSLYAKEP